tara:strand:- start:3936 stop:4394 length:459 start_codon:yes stop_codon:yes gene_type:complete
MCGPLAILASAGSTMIKMNAQQKAGEAEKKRFDRRARQIKIDRDMGKVQAMQRQTARVQEYLSAEKSNMAVFSASGVDVDSASQVAFAEANAITVGEDVAAIALQADYKSRTRTIESGLATERGKNSLSAGYANMVGTATTGIYNLATINTG